MFADTMKITLELQQTTNDVFSSNSHFLNNDFEPVTFMEVVNRNFERTSHLPKRLSNFYLQYVIVFSTILLLPL